MELKKLNLVKNAALFLFALCINFAALAQHGKREKPSKEQMEKHQAFRKEMREYFAGNVCPTLAGQRAKLEAKMSSEDKNRIAEIRKELGAIKATHKETRKAHHEAMKNGEEPKKPSEEEREKMHESGKKVRKLMLEVWTIADKYDTEMRALREETKAQAEQWKTDLKAISEKHKPADADKKQSMKGENEGEKEGKGGRHHRRGKGMKGEKGGIGIKKMLSPVGFMLFDGDCNKASEEDDVPNGTEEDDDFEGDESLVFPNPSADSNVLQFSVKKEGNVKVDLYDKDGKFLRTLSDESRKTGEHRLRSDLNDLQKGVYYYRISGPDGNESRRFLVE